MDAASPAVGMVVCDHYFEPQSKADNRREAAHPGRTTPVRSRSLPSP